MSSAIVIVTILSEVLAIIICLHATFRKKVKLDKWLLVIVILDCVILYLANIKVIPQIGSLMVYVVTWIYCYLVFETTAGIVLRKYVIGIVICGLMEVIIAYLLIPLKYILDLPIISLLCSVILLILVCGVGGIVSKAVRILDYKNDRKLMLFTILYSSAIIAIVLDYNFSGTPLSIYVVGVLACLLAIYLFIVKLMQDKVDIERKNLEMELHQIYGDTYDELLSTVRKRQHDFDNQLSAVYSMHITATSLDELVERQRQYTAELLENCRYDSILTKCENPILAGYLYNRCLVCENLGIKVNYDISVTQAECSFPLYEVVEILGIFIDNACESLNDSQIKPSVIKLVVEESSDKLVLSVSNPSKAILYSEIEKMFLKDVSTKGEYRGIGLARAKELTNEHKTDIRVTNYTNEDINWIQFKVEISK